MVFRAFSVVGSPVGWALMNALAAPVSAALLVLAVDVGG